MENYNIFISKVMFSLIALFGFLIIFLTGLYYGYTFHENEQYFYNGTTEIKFVNYINEKYTYNFIHNPEEKYGEELAGRITFMTMILTIIGVILLQIGTLESLKYRYKNSLKQRLKNFWQKIKESEP